jgi:hypothetical protein
VKATVAAVAEDERSVVVEVGLLARLTGDGGFVRDDALGGLGTIEEAVTVARGEAVSGELSGRWDTSREEREVGDGTEWRPLGVLLLHVASAASANKRLVQSGHALADVAGIPDVVVVRPKPRCIVFQIELLVDLREPQQFCFHSLLSLVPARGGRQDSV